MLCTEQAAHGGITSDNVYFVFFLSKVGQMSQIGVMEHLKLENVTLSHQLTETQHRSIKEKERIAVQLQSIEVYFLIAVVRFVKSKASET